MAAGATYEPIATSTLGSAASSVTFSSISGSYTDLVLVGNGLVTVSNSGVTITFNNTGGGTYSNTRLIGDGSTAAGQRSTNQDSGILNYNGNWTTANNDSNFIVHINSYSSTFNYKTYLSRANRYDSGTDLIMGLWRSTSAITTITLAPSVNQFAAGATFTLYGITAA